MSGRCVRKCSAVRVIHGERDRGVAEAARIGQDPAGKPEGRARLEARLLSTPLPPGSNRVIASHGNPFHAVGDAAYLAEGEAAVVRPLGASGFKVIARIPKDGWDALVAP